MSEAQRAQRATHGKTIFFAFLIGLAVVGCLFLAFLLAPHKTGIVTSGGRVSSHTWYSGVGRHKSKNSGYASDVRVRIRDTGETVTVHYRVGNALDIPQVGEEVQVADYPLTGYGPYPEMWAVKMGALVLGVDMLLYIGYLVAAYRKKRT